MADFQFRAIISVINRAVEPLKAINRQVAATFAPFRKLGGAMKEIGEVSGLKRIGESVWELGKSFGELGRKVLEVAGPVTALFGVASLGGLVEMSRRVSEFGSELARTAKIIGISAQQLGELHYAAELSDVETESLDTGLKKLNKTIGEAAAGKNKDALELFRHLGISLRDANGHLHTSADLFPQLAEAFSKTQDPAMRARMAVALFGKAGQDLLPLLLEGKDNLAAMAKEARDVGYAMSDEAAEAAKKNEDAWKAFTLAIQGVSNTIGSGLFPVLTPLLGDLRDWIAANREFIATGVHKAVDALVTALKNIDWERLWRVVQGVANAFGSLVRAIGPGPALFGSLAAVIAGPIIASLIKLSATLLATPAGWFMLAIGAIAFAVYEIYENWDGIKQWFSELWAKVQDAFERFRGWIAGEWNDAVSAVVGWVQRAWSGLSGWFSGVWADVQGTFMAYIGWLKSVFTGDVDGAIAPFKAAWEGLKSWFKGLWAEIEGIFTDAWASIGGVIDKISGAVKTVTGAVSSVFGGGGEDKKEDTGSAGEASAGASDSSGTSTGAPKMPVMPSGGRFGNLAANMQALRAAQSAKAQAAAAAPVTLNQQVVINKASPDTTATITTQAPKSTAVKRFGQNYPAGGNLVFGN